MMTKRFTVMHIVEYHDDYGNLIQDEEEIEDFETEEKAAEKIEKLGGEKIRMEDDDWYDPLADPVGYYWIREN